MTDKTKLERVREAIETIRVIANVAHAFDDISHYTALNEAEQALVEKLEHLETGGWRDAIKNPPANGVPVIVKGGLAMRKTGGVWYTGMEEPLYQRPIEWQVTHWQPLPPTKESE